MPTECVANPLQRALADAIILMKPLDEIRILFACGAKVNEPVAQGLRPLHYAVWQRHIDAVRLLLVRGADINEVDDCGYSALHLCSEHGYVDIAKLLIENGSKIDFREPTDELYPRTMLCDEPLRLALKNRNYAMARLLLEHGADPNKRYFLGAEISLVTESESIELLLTYGASTESRDRQGLTPLMRACRFNYGTEQVLMLLNHGADVNAMTDHRNDYRTVLHYAVLSGSITLVNLLLKQGAKTDRLPPEGESDKPNPLHLAILRGDPAIVRCLLEAGADINRSSTIIGSPLHVACADNIPHRVEIMKMLLSYGADPNVRIPSETGAYLRPCLGELLANSDTTTVEELQLLLKHGARVCMRTQFRDPDGLLNCLKNVASYSRVFEVLLETAECFDIAMIKRNLHLTDSQRKKLLQKAKTPIPLKALVRNFFRSTFKRTLPEKVPCLFIPSTLHSYLLCERH
ncbi:ankyrin-1-like isoform X2 [Sitodiplosis mosellana]|nr:ankyrin-1-like isoform X2 [Sitodiplosis mosellana]